MYDITSISERRFLTQKNQLSIWNNRRVNDLMLWTDWQSELKSSFTIEKVDNETIEKPY